MLTCDVSDRPRFGNKTTQLVHYLCIMMLLMFNILLVVGYMVLSVYVTKGIPVSLSATYYTLGRWGWLFQAVMYSTGFCILPVWLELTEYQYLSFLTCGGLLFVASAPFYRLPLEGFVHYSSAVVCCVSAVLWQILEGFWDITMLWAFLCGMLVLRWRDKYMWWIEVVVIGSLFSNLLRIL